MVDTLTQLDQALQTVLDRVPEEQGRPSGFIKRQRKLTASAFVKALVFGYLAEPGASGDGLARAAASLGSPISPQALDERLTDEAAELLLRVLQAALAAVVAADPIPIPLLGRFTEVVVLDSTTIALPEPARGRWPGCAAGTAAIKFSVAWDLKSGRLRNPGLAPGRVNDKAAEPADEPLPAGSPRVADLGYFRLESFARLAAGGAYFLSRLQVGTTIVDAGGRPWPRPSELLGGLGPRVDMPILLGAARRLPCRLLAARVPEAVAQRRVARLREEAGRDGRRLSPECEALAAWTVLVTNAPAGMLDLDEALALGRARWQIELLFKLWKGQGGVDRWSGSRPAKALCQVYAKLIAAVIKHWVMLTSGWEHVGRSALKVGQAIRGLAWQLAEAVGDRPALARLVGRLRAICRVGCQLNRRKKRPNTYQRLLDPLIDCLT